jgi:hypoxanthine phosphoribosyltransferase
LLIRTKVRYYFHIFAPANSSIIGFMKEICILDKKFREFLTKKDIQQRIEELARHMNTDLAGKEVVFIGILNGAFLFAADLFRLIEFPSRITFVKLASYQGTGSSGSIKELIGWNEDIKNKTIVVIEDIVDTGNTLERIVDELVIRKATEIKIVALLYKPAAYTKDIHLDYVGFEIPNNFVVGYGLDYDGLGRNLPSVYALIK